MKPSERVQAALEALGMNIRVIEFDASTAIAEQASRAAGCTLGAIVKSLVFLIDGHPILVLVAGDRMADQRKLAAHFGLGKKKVRLADSETVRSVTGYEVGGVPPIGHDVHLPVLIDASLARFDTVWAAAGTGNAVFPIPFSRLIEITVGELAEVA
jgi:Cys-tRNA(Pro) deacylase